MSKKFFLRWEKRKNTNYARMPTRIATVGKKPAQIPPELIMFCRESERGSLSGVLFRRFWSSIVQLKISIEFLLRERKKLIIEIFSRRAIRHTKV